MEIVSLGPLAVASLVWQPRPSAFTFTVVAKATYSLQQGHCVLADEPVPVHDRDRPRDDKPGSSLLAPNDLVPIKPRAEAMVVGHAFAPGKQPARSLLVRLAVGELDKRIEVYCERAMGQDGSIQGGSGFLRMPLIYERAAGGPGTWNPVGVRADARDTYGRRVLPNVQLAGTAVKGLADVIEPAGLGPIAPSWPHRTEKLGRHAASLPAGISLSRPLPEGLDLAYFNAAPLDQQLPALRENERILLEGLHPEHAKLVTSLPGVRPAAFVDRGRGGERLQLRADTLWIDTDRAIVTLTWRGQIGLERADEAGRVLVALESPGREVSFADAERLFAQRRGSSTGVRAVREPEAPAPAADAAHALEGTMNIFSSPAGAVALPFTGSAAPAAPAQESRAPMPSSPALPFQNPASPLNQSSASWPSAPAPPPRARMDSSPDWGALPPPATSARANLSDSAVFRAPVAPPPAAPAPLSAPAPSSAVALAPALAPLTSPASPPIDSPWAAGAAAPLPSPQPVPAPLPAPMTDTPAFRPAPMPRARLEPREAAVRLLWFDPEVVPRLRRKPAFREILRGLEKRPLDADLDDPAHAKDPSAMEDQREVFEILARGEATDAGGVNEALWSAVREDGKFIAPLVLLAGDLSFVFDELETLKATLTTVTPLVTPTDENLQRTCDLAKTFLQTPGLLSGPAVAEGLTSRLREAFGQGKRMVPAGYLEQQTELALLEQRHYKKRRVFGGPHLRAQFYPSGSSQPIPTYIPADVADLLPLYQRFRARFAAEGHLQEDQSEAHPASLRVVALARAAPAPKR